MTLFRLPNPLISLSLIASLAAPLTAAPTAPPAAPPAAPAAPSAPAPVETPAQVVVGGTLIHVIRTTWGGHTPQQRAEQVQQRLITALAQGPVYASDIIAGQMQGDWCVLVRGQRFLTADPQTAEQEHSTPEILAGEWAARLQQVLPDLIQPSHK